MATFTLKFKDSVISEHGLEQEGTLTIGRKETNNIVIDNMAVSGLHAKIDSIENGFLLTDLKSKNGTFVNDKAITTHWLKKDDIITIGKHKIHVALAPGEEKEEQSITSDKTMMLDTDDYKAMLDKSAQDKDSKSVTKEPVGILSMLKGAQGEFEIKKKLIKIGKDPSCDIIVSGFLVGKTSATISKRPTGFYISFVEGMTKPKVNGKTLQDSVLLKEFDKVEIGSVTMEFIIRE